MRNKMHKHNDDDDDDERTITWIRMQKIRTGH